MAVMAAKILQGSRAARRLAEAQHHVISRQQLLGLGFTDHAIRHRVHVGRLFPVWPGVYAVGRRSVTRFGWWSAAILRCGPHAVLSHRSAASLWEIAEGRLAPIHVSVPYRIARHSKGIVTHRRTVLEPAHITLHRNIPVTNPISTLIDITPGLSRSELEAA